MDPVTCRHCPGQLTRLDNDTWTDEFGMTACVKGVLLPVRDREPGKSIFAAPVLHEPMPAGLRGASRQGREQGK